METLEEKIKEKMKYVHHIHGPFYTVVPVMDPEHCIELRDAGITHIINTGNLPNDQFLQAHGFNYFHPLFPHTGRKQPYQLWENLSEYLQNIIDNDLKVACHCIGGQQRSLSAIYLGMRLMKMEIQDVFDAIERVTTDNVSYHEFIEEYLRDKAAGKITTRFVGSG
tara:strand:+ start:141 stop:638 length:498 start_codon:yes stop_codon:yes gene_type:complete